MVDDESLQRTPPLSEFEVISEQSAQAIYEKCWALANNLWWRDGWTASALSLKPKE